MLLGEPSGQELSRGRIDPDLASGGHTADSCRQVHRIADGRVLQAARRANVAYQRFPRVDAKPKRAPDSEGSGSAKRPSSSTDASAARQACKA